MDESLGEITDRRIIFALSEASRLLGDTFKDGPCNTGLFLKALRIDVNFTILSTWHISDFV